jgi:hypothetical protein
MKPETKKIVGILIVCIISILAVLLVLKYKDDVPDDVPDDALDDAPDGAKTTPIVPKVLSKWHSLVRINKGCSNKGPSGKTDWKHVSTTGKLFDSSVKYRDSVGPIRMEDLMAACIAAPNNACRGVQHASNNLGRIWYRMCPT